MASASSFLSSGYSPLTGAVAGVSAGTINADDSYRRYRSGLAIGVYEHGQYVYARRSIFYEVGRRSRRLRDSLGPHGDEVDPIDASVAINSVQAANFEGFARKYSNFSPQWERMDLAGIAERLAKGVAAQSVYGGVTIRNLRGNTPVRVVALGTLDSPQTASTDSVFIPRTVDTVGNDHVFAVLSAAANGEGASVTTDVLRLDANTNEPIVPAVEGPALATACVEALRILGANMEESGAGDLFAYAVTRGVHSVVSVVAHTDEGGIMRSLLRHGRFRVPYGGINQALRDYPGLPPVAGQSASAVSSWVDAVALKTAAVVAHCDPCVTATGGLYPTVITSGSGDISPPGTDEGDDVDDTDARTVGRLMAADVGRFAPFFLEGLVALFGLKSNSLVAESHFSTVTADYLYNTNDRHLRHKTVAPYFWIEPTSLLPPTFLGSPAENGGFGALASPGEERALPAFERVRELDRGRNANFSTVAFKMRTARTSGLVAAYAAAPAPLASLKLYQFDEDSIVLAGDQGPTVGDVPTKHAAADPLSSYLWTRGQSAIPAPAEMINIQGSYASKYKIVTWDDDFDATLEDLPEAWELEGHPTLWRVSVPTALASGPSNYEDRDARRARSRAAIALAQAAVRSRAWGEASSPVITVSNVPPTWDEERAPVSTEGTSVHAPDPGNTYVRGDNNPSAGAPPVRGGPVAPVPHHQPLRGAPFPPRSGPGGGSAPLPPGGPGGPPAGTGPPPDRPVGPPDETTESALAAAGESEPAGAEPAPHQ